MAEGRNTFLADSKQKKVRRISKPEKIKNRKTVEKLFMPCGNKADKKFFSLILFGKLSCGRMWMTPSRIASLEIRL